MVNGSLWYALITLDITSMLSYAHTLCRNLGTSSVEVPESLAKFCLDNTRCSQTDSGVDNYSTFHGRFARKMQGLSYIAEPVAFPTMSSISMDEGTNIEANTNSTAPRNAHGWDGKLRIDKKATLTNPEALSDPEYSDEEAPLPEVIEADEGMSHGLLSIETYSRNDRSAGGFRRRCRCTLVYSNLKYRH